MSTAGRGGGDRRNGTRRRRLPCEPGDIGPEVPRIRRHRRAPGSTGSSSPASCPARPPAESARSCCPYPSDRFRPPPSAASPGSRTPPSTAAASPIITRSRAELPQRDMACASARDVCCARCRRMGGSGCNGRYAMRGIGPPAHPVFFVRWPSLFVAPPHKSAAASRSFRPNGTRRPHRRGEEQCIGHVREGGPWRRTGAGNRHFPTARSGCNP